MKRVKLSANILWRPLLVLILLAISTLLITKIYLITKNIDHIVDMQTEQIRKKSISEIESTARLLTPLNSSALNLARALGSSLEGIDLDFEAIRTKIAPTLFVAFSTIPHVSQVAYIRSDGEFYSFYSNGHQTFAVFSNDSSTTHSVYIQPVNRDNGKVYGEASSLNSSIFVNNLTLFQEVLEDHKVHSLFLNVDWSEDKMMFVYCVQVDGKGMISMSFPSKIAKDYFKDIDFRGGFLHLASKDGKLILDTRESEAESSQFTTNKTSVSAVKTVNRLKEKDIPLKCNNLSDEIFGKFKHRPHCSSIDIAGIPSIYVLGYPEEDFDSKVFEKNQTARTLVVIKGVILFISVCTFTGLLLWLAKREICLCASLIKQKEATQQAERKSMKKSLAYAIASHDIRASLSTITTLIKISQDETPVSEGLMENLTSMKNSAKHLLEILTTVLDASKLEAGKMTLVEEEFNLVQLIEETVYMHYPVGLSKGIDVIFDTCDGSIFTSSSVKGDSFKLKQILNNLLSNAVKFTDKGHVTVRAMVKEPNIEREIISSNSHGVMKFLSKLFCKNCTCLNSLDGIQGQKRGDVEFVIEVEDTGKGIPKDKYKSVFEDFVQVEETAFGKGGSGLGLGIVQSLVRLMGGEIKIVDKEHGRKGTCFTFNIFLTASHIESNLAQQQSHPHKIDDGFLFKFLQNPVAQSRPPPHKLEGSHVVLAMVSEGRMIILKKIIEHLGIKVTIVDQEKNLIQVIIETMVNLAPSKPNSPNNNELCYIDLYKSDSIKSTKNNDVHGKKSNSKMPSNFTLILIDSCIVASPDLTSALKNLKKEVRSSMCKVVLLENLVTRSKYDVSIYDHIVTRPFHGSCVYKVLRKLPEFGGDYRYTSKSLEIGDNVKSKGVSFEHPLEEIVTHKHEVKDPAKPLTGKNVLVVDDDGVLQMGTKRMLEKLGAKVHVCVNGKDAYDHVCEVLVNRMAKGKFQALPYDCIFMDCEMNEMDGYESTKLIRKEELIYNFYIPIVALSSHAKESAEGEIRTKRAGMDYYLEKPLKMAKLLEVIRYVDTNMDHQS